MTLEIDTRITIRYKLNRSDLWQTYWRVWRRGWKLKAAQLVIALAVFYPTLNYVAPHGHVGAREVAFALAVTLVVLACLPLYPLLRFKPHERTLTIGSDGIATTIGKIAATVPWHKVERVTSEGEHIYIVGKNQNAFAIPSVAFSSEQEREAFLRSPQHWLSASHG